MYHKPAHKDTVNPACQIEIRAIRKTDSIVTDDTEERKVMTQHDAMKQQKELNERIVASAMSKSQHKRIAAQLDPEVNFFHMRNWWFDRNIDRTVPYCRGGVTIAAVELPDGLIRYNMAICSFNDNFCRKVGRNIAETRLKSGKVIDHFWAPKYGSQYYESPMHEFAEWVHEEFLGECINDY